MRWLRYILSLGRLGGHAEPVPDVPVPHFTWTLGSRNRQWQFSNIERSWTLESKDRIWNLSSRK
jgi:hypothetical protein